LPIRGFGAKETIWTVGLIRKRLEIQRGEDGSEGSSKHGRRRAQENCDQKKFRKPGNAKRARVCGIPTSYGGRDFAGMWFRGRPKNPRPANNERFGENYAIKKHQTKRERGPGVVTRGGGN